VEERTIWVIVIIVGAVALITHAGHIGALVSGTNSAAPGVQVADSGTSGPMGAPGSPAGIGSGTVETFALKSIGGQYDPAVIRVKQGTTVRIDGDPQTLSGCMAVVNIQGYGISKLIRQNDHIIEFTANQKGTFPMYCNMGIGNGRLVVE